jgi:hypothetical protein
VKIESIDDQWIILFALNYALPRQSMASIIMFEFIQGHIDRFTESTIGYMVRDIENAIVNNRCGSETVDKPTWVELLAFLKRKQEEIVCSH